MWPPRSPGLRLARTTIAIAFQRISERMRHSICASPGDLASWPGGMVLMYSVVGANGRCAPARRVSSTMPLRSEEHTSELQSLMRISYAVFCLKKKNREVQQISDWTEG